MLTQFRLTVLKLLPKNLLTIFIGKLANCRLPSSFLNCIIRIFSSIYKINTEEIEPSQFRCFNDFFIRHLKAEARPINADINSIVSPVDGKIGAYGQIEQGTLFQAKGLLYSLADLVVKPDYAALFQNGSYMTIYLSPRDYHRIHAPLEGNIVESFYIPGKLFPVNPFAVKNIPNLFSINERLITVLQQSMGKIAVIKVGATVVGKIKVVYDDLLESKHSRQTIFRQYKDIFIHKGEELGRFEMGSTVILLFPGQTIQWVSNLEIGQSLRLGQAIAYK